MLANNPWWFLRQFYGKRGPRAGTCIPADPNPMPRFRLPRWLPR